MIIQRVWSENVFKYATLELQDLPTHGIIGVSGQNEAGKSTIGEIICLALFGRTFSYAAHEIVNVIRWGEPHCAVAVDFSINRHRYVVSRFLDKNGHHGVRLSDQNDNPLARGVEPVRDALEALLGFGYDEFIESFYLAQREITTPHPHSTAVKKIAGIGALEHVAAHAVAEIQHEHAAISDTEGAIAQVDQQIADLDLDESLLPIMERQRHDLGVLQEQGWQTIGVLRDKSKRYEEAGEKITCVVEAFCEVGPATTYQGWRTHVQNFAARVEELGQQHHDDETLARLLEVCTEVAGDAQTRLSTLDTLRDSARRYRQYLAHLLGEAAGRHEEHHGPAVEPLDMILARLQNQLNTAMRSRTRARVGLSVFLLLALMVWAVWSLLTNAPTSGMAQGVSAWLANIVGAWEPAYNTWLLRTAVGLSALCLLCGWRSLRLNASIAQLRQSSDAVYKQMMAARAQASTLDTFESMPLPQAVSVLAGIQDAEVAVEVRSFQQSTSGDWIDAARLEAYRTQLRSLQGQFASKVQGQCKTLAAEIETREGDMAMRQRQIAQLSEDIAREQACHQQLHTYKAVRASHREQIALRQQRIQVRQLAGDLLEGSAQHIAKTFNRDIRSLVSRTLPLLTQGRYEHLKIDENLDVQVFSNEKRDFMQLEEISSGTQRQIMLAVRLALSQQFINTTLGCHQFIFLDEPFAFFDEERKLSALRALPQLSEELSQIWIVAQTFPQDFAFDLHIHCRPDADVLRLTGGGE